MPNVVHCPGCGKSYRVSADALGRRLQCKKCGEMFEVGAPSVPSAAEPAPASAPPGSGPLEVLRQGEATIVRVHVARLNSDNVEEIGEALLALAEDPAHKRMILNLANVEFLFSTAMGKIMALEKKLQAQRGSLKLCGLRPLVREALDSAGLTLILRVFDTEAQALASRG